MVPGTCKYSFERHDHHMFNSVKNIIHKLYDNNIIRYIFFGGLTTLVNLITYVILRNLMDYNIANFISIVLAICFAYFVNSRFIFKSIANTLEERTKEFFKFIAARFSTMIIELVGVFIFVEIIVLNDMITKILIQFLVLILNYIFSKLIVFKKK